MEFNKDRVYTSLNADEVKIGSIGYYADSLEGLVQEFTQQVPPKKLAQVDGPGSHYRFVVEENQTAWNLFYLVAEPEEVEFCTYRELAKWLMYGTGEYIYKGSDIVSTGFNYDIEKENDTVNATAYRVRKWGDTEWHEPTRKYMGIEE